MRYRSLLSTGILYISSCNVRADIIFDKSEKHELLKVSIISHKYVYVYYSNMFRGLPALIAEHIL